MSLETLLSCCTVLKKLSGLRFELGSSVSDYQNFVSFGLPARSSSAYVGI
jgi:hypothetical protein